MRAARWLAPDADAARALTRQPRECLARGPQPYLVEVGRAAFRTPLLLGGQAARAGISCEACHANGRRNGAFFFPGLSGAPGTADVTSAVFSRTRDDGVFNPKPIPDLGGDKQSLRIDQSPGGPLRAFIRGLIVEEFNGAEPTPVVLDGLAAYVRTLDPRFCARAASAAVTPAGAISDAGRAAAAAGQSLAAGDSATAVLLVGAARSALARLDERYAVPGLERDRDRIRAASAELARALTAIRTRDTSAGNQLAAWRARLPVFALVLRRDAPHSLYAIGPLRLALAR